MVGPINPSEEPRTVAAEVAVLVVDSFHLPGDLLDLAVLAQTGHEVGLLVLHGAVGAAEKDDLILQTDEEQSRCSSALLSFNVQTCQ